MSYSTILITGANRGIGMELTRQFTEDGWQVLACCRSPADAKSLQALATEYPTVEIFPLDVTDYDQLATLTLQLQDRSIDIMLSNAGIYGPREYSFGEVAVKEGRQVRDVVQDDPRIGAYGLDVCEGGGGELSRAGNQRAVG